MDSRKELSELIQRLLTAQRFAVLATQFEGQPYSNLVAFAADGFRALLFVTSRETRKYSNSLASKKVALLIDSRTNQISDFNNAIAITALGAIAEVAADSRDRLSGIYLSKHPQLREFLIRPSNALMKVAVTDYIVATFEGVKRFPVGKGE